MAVSDVCPWLWAARCRDSRVELTGQEQIRFLNYIIDKQTRRIILYDAAATIKRLQ